MSSPPTRRGSHGARPHARTGSRPASNSSSARLHAGLPAAQEQHAARRELVRVAVLRRGEHAEPIRKAGGGRRVVRRPVGAGADDDGVRLPHTVRRDQVEAGAGARPDLLDRHAALDGAGVGGDALEVGDDLVPGHVALGVVARVGMAGEIQRPVGRHQGEAVPAPPPGRTDVLGLEHDMLQPRQAQPAAHRQPRLAGPEHDHAHPSRQPLTQRSGKPQASTISGSPSSSSGAASNAAGGSRHRSGPAPWMASQTRSGVQGRSMWRTPRWLRASTTAFWTAGVAPMVADSPMPLAPSGFTGVGVSVLLASRVIASAAVGMA